MSAITDQFNCERIMIAILALQADLVALNAAGGIVHEDAATETSAGTIDRIVVTGAPRTVFSYGKNMATPVMFSVILTVTIHLASNSPTTLDTYLAAIQAANAAGAAPAGIVTLATSLFGARGFDMFNVESGERSNGENERTASIQWECRFGA